MTRPSAAPAPAPVRRRWAAGIVAAVPAAVLLGSYAFLAFRHQAANLLPVVVHEDGRRTLPETILYFRHFLQELPICLFLAAAVNVAGAWQAPVIPLSGARARARALRTLRRRLGIALAAGVTGVIAWVGWREGGGVVLAELLQRYTRGEPGEFGSHWRYHWLHLADTMPFCIGLALLLRGLTAAGPVTPGPARRTAAWCLARLAVTAVTGSPRVALTDPAYPAHQVREIEAHRLLTVPLAFSAVLLLERGVSLPGGAGEFQPGPCWRGLAWIGAATLIPPWILWRLRQVDVLALARCQSDLRELAAARAILNIASTICSWRAWRSGGGWAGCSGRPITPRSHVEP